MKKWNVVIIAMALLMLSPSIYGQKKELDTANSKITWEGRKVTGKHHGQIDLTSGYLEKSGDVFVDGRFVVNMASLTNHDLTEDPENRAKLEGHLKSDDFFGVEKYPVSTLNIKHGKMKEPGVYTFTGDMTIKEETHPVEFDALVDETAGSTQFKGTITVDRSKYNVRYGSRSFFDNLGDKFIYDDFTLNFEVMLK